MFFPLFEKIINDTPINPKIAPDAPAENISASVNKNVNRLPIRPQKIYVKI